MPLLFFTIKFIKKHWMLISIFNLLLISFLSLTPLEQLPAVPGSDKIHHLLAYAALIFPCALSRPRYWISITCFCIAWSGAIELIQPLANRYGEWLDFGANTLGIALGILSAQLVNYFYSKHLEVK